MSRVDPQRGSVLAEILVTILLVAVAMGGIVALLLASVRHRLELDARLEVRQGLEASIDTLVRDVRLAGACLPVLGDFLSLDGDDLEGTDSVTIRTGHFHDGLTCIRTAIREEMPASSVELKVESTEGFAEDMLVFLAHPNGSGEFERIRLVQSAAQMLQLAAAPGQAYPPGSGLYAVEERRYAIVTEPPGSPRLTLSRDGEAPEPFADGIEELQIRYRLERDCPPCDVVELPADQEEWRIVKELEITVTSRVPSGLGNGELVRMRSTTSAKPRNLLP